MGDLLWLRQNGLEAEIKKLAAQGTPLLGICGGYQMLGRSLSDPDGVEEGGMLAEMGLLPCDTVFLRRKIRRRTRAKVVAPMLAGGNLAGYEIHMGETTVHGAPFAAWTEENQKEPSREMYLGPIFMGCLTRES